MSSNLLMNYAAISLFRIALDFRAALTSNSVHARKEVKNSEHARKEVKNSEHARKKVKNSVYAMVKTEEHACCSKSKAPDIFSSDDDRSGEGGASRHRLVFAGAVESASPIGGRYSLQASKHCCQADHSIRHGKTEQGRALAF